MNETGEWEWKIRHFQGQYKNRARERERKFGHMYYVVYPVKQENNKMLDHDQVLITN